MAKVIGITTLILLVLIAIPRTLIHDSATTSRQESACLKLEADLLFDNPIEKILIQKIVVDRNKQDIGLISAYTLGGLKYATAEVTCHGGARVIWRRWFGKS